VVVVVVIDSSLLRVLPHSLTRSFFSLHDTFLSVMTTSNMRQYQHEHLTFQLSPFLVSVFSLSRLLGQGHGLSPAVFPLAVFQLFPIPIY